MRKLLLSAILACSPMLAWALTVDDLVPFGSMAEDLKDLYSVYDMEADKSNGNNLVEVADHQGAPVVKIRHGENTLAQDYNIHTGVVRSVSFAESCAAEVRIMRTEQGLVGAESWQGGTILGAKLDNQYLAWVKFLDSNTITAHSHDSEGAWETTVLLENAQYDQWYTVKLQMNYDHKAQRFVSYNVYLDSDDDGIYDIEHLNLRMTNHDNDSLQNRFDHFFIGWQGDELGQFLVDKFRFYAMDRVTTEKKTVERPIKQIGLLRALGILDDSLALDQPLTRGDAAYLVSNLLNMGQPGRYYIADTPIEGRYDAICTVLDFGFMTLDGDGNFRPQEIMPTENFMAVLLRVMGAEGRAKLQGYTTAAYDLDLMKGVELTETLTGQQAVFMVYNMLAQKYQSMRGDGVTLSDNRTIMQIYRNTFGAKGIVTATGQTGLNNPSGVKRKEIIIGDVLMTWEEHAPIIGAGVEFFYKQTDQGNVLVYYDDSQNQLLTIPAAEIGQTDNLVQINYGQNRSAHIAVQADFIYNGRNFQGVTPQHLSPANGDVTLMDNNQDGVFDVVFINQAAVYPVAALVGNKLYSKQGQPPIDLEPALGRGLLEVFMNDGSKILPDDIREGDICSVYRSEGGVVCRIVVTRVSKSGTVAELGREGERLYYTIDNLRLGVANSLLEQTSEDQLPPVGSLVTVYFNEYLDIAYFSDQVITKDLIGLYINAHPKGGAAKNYEVKILTDNGTVTVFETAGRYQHSDIPPSTPVIYKLDQQLMITKLTELTVLHKDASAIYMKDSMSFHSIDGFLANFSSQTPVFVVPPDASQHINDDDYYAAAKHSMFANNELYNFISLYELDNGQNSRAIVYKNDLSQVEIALTPLFVVDKITQTMNGAGDMVKKLTGNAGEVEFCENSPGIIGNNVRPGDIVRVQLFKGEIAKISAHWTAESAFDGKGVGVDEAYIIAQSRTTYGRLTKVQGNNIYIDTGARQFCFNADGAKIILFTDKSIPIDKRDLSAYQTKNYPDPSDAPRVFIHSRGGKVQHVFVLEG